MFSPIEKEIKGDQARCFHIIDDENSPRYGQECGQLLMTAAAGRQMCGRVVCRRRKCQRMYEIKDDKILLVAIWDKSKREYVEINQLKEI